MTMSKFKQYPGIQQIKLSNDRGIVIIDDQDLDLVSAYKWSLHSQGYAVSGKILMHRLILGVVDNPAVQVDHRNHCKTDNRRANIRVCTRSENLRNSRKLKGISQYKGVYRDGKAWHCQIFKDKTVKNLGLYRSEMTAARIYDKNAREIYGEFANPNFKEIISEPEQLKIFRDEMNNN